MIVLGVPCKPKLRFPDLRHRLRALNNILQRTLGFSDLPVWTQLPIVSDGGLDDLLVGDDRIAVRAPCVGQGIGSHCESCQPLLTMAFS